jgi:hypothetical protein
MVEAVSKLGALERGPSCRFGEARRLTVFGGANKLFRDPSAAGANYIGQMTGSGERRAQCVYLPHESRAGGSTSNNMHLCTRRKGVQRRL